MGTTVLLSAEEFLNLPDMPGKQELLDGELIELPPAKLTHLQVIKWFQELLETVLPRTRVWVDGGYQLGRRSRLQPDVSVSWPDQRVENDWMQGAPMLIVEVISPANRPGQIDRKIAAYLDQGAAEVWVVYPEAPSMTVFRKGSWERITETYESSMVGVTVDLHRMVQPSA